MARVYVRHGRMVVSEGELISELIKLADGRLDQMHTFGVSPSFDVCFWHITDIPRCQTDVRFRG